MNNLKQLRKGKGLTQTELAKIIGIGQSGYSDWERGVTKIDSDSLNKLASFYGVTVDYLLGNDDNPPIAGKRIPVLGSIPAGIPLEAIEDIIDWEEIPSAMLAGGNEYFALQVKGDSMWPDYLPGDVVIVKKTPCFDSGDVCVVYVNGYNATLKKVRKTDDGWVLVPKNQAYPPRTYSPKEIAELPVSIAGIVVELRRRVK